MNNCTITGLSSTSACREFSVTGIKRVWIAPFGTLFNYTYTNDDLGKVTGLTASFVPVEYKVIEGEFTENYLYQASSRYTHNLTFVFTKMDKDKRNEFEKLIGETVTVIFEDKNGKCWITGQDFGLRSTGFKAGTGGSDNQYTFTLEGRALNQVREITCFNSTCFASFTGLELRQSQFAIENASLFDFSGDWEMIADADLLMYTPAQALDPLNWSNPTIKAQDLAELTNFVGNPSTSISIYYDNILDIAYISFTSSDTSYDFLTFNAGTQQISNITITLNLQAVLSTSLFTAATTITVVDGTSSVVYSGNVGDSIGSIPSSVYGTVENAFVVVSDLYPNGTTFTATIDNTACGAQVFEYVSEPTANCTFGSQVGYYFGYDYLVDIPKSSIFENFRQITIRFEECHFPIITGLGDQTSDFATVQSLIVNALSSCPLIDSASIAVTNFAGFIRVYFRATDTLGSCSVEYLDNLNDLIVVGATQFSLLNIETLAPTPSSITIKDSSLNALAGITGAAPTFNSGFVVEDIEGIADGNIENIGVLFTGYPETEPFTITVKTDGCPNSTFPFDSAVCYDSTNLTLNKRYELWKLDVSALADADLGINFGLVYEEPLGVLAIPFTTTSNLVGNQNSQEWVDAFHSNLPVLATNGDLPFRILKFTFDAANWVYWLELEVDNDVQINDIEVDDVPTAFTLVDSTDITFVEGAVPTMNPYTGFAWSFNDYYANAQALSATGETPITTAENVVYNSYTFEYDSGAGEVVLAVSGAPNPTTLTYSFYDAGFSLIGDLSFAGASYSDTPVGDPNDYAYIVVTNSLGLFAVITYDHTTQQDIVLPINTQQNFLNFWGKYDRWFALTPAIFVPSPIITSALCP